MKSICLLFILLLSPLSFATPQHTPFFWSTNSQEATLSYEFYVIYRNYLTTPPSEEEALTAAQEQASYLFGSLANHELKGSPRETINIEVLSVVKSTSPGSWKISYNYQGVIQTQHKSSFTAPLPFEPQAAYIASIRSNGDAPCTDISHIEYEYFWYFFNPTAYKCPLKEGIHYEYVPMKIKTLKNTQKTFPEYERLIQDGEISIHLLFGMDDPSLDFNPLESLDINAENYLQVRNTLLENGFTVRQMQAREFKKLAPAQQFSQIYVEELTKQTPKALIKIRMFFGGADGYAAVGFKYLFKDAIENSSLLIYSGHSGLGEYLKISELEESENLTITAPHDRYQIYFFNGCSTYPYYSSQYFNLKKSELDPKGSQNLDIITNGLATYFHDLGSSNLSIISAVYAWANNDIKTSYQEMISSADSDNLIAIIGDEDNP